MLVPIKAFRDAKAPPRRRARRPTTAPHSPAMMARRVLARRRAVPDVRRVRRRRGRRHGRPDTAPRCCGHPGSGSTARSTNGVDVVAGKGAEHVVIAHGDLPARQRIRPRRANPARHARARPPPRRHQRPVADRPASFVAPIRRRELPAPPRRRHARLAHRVRVVDRPVPGARRRHDRRLRHLAAADARDRSRRHSMSANEPGQPPTRWQTPSSISRRRPSRWPSAPTPTTSSSGAAARSRSGPPTAASSTTWSAPTDRRAPGTRTPTSPRSPAPPGRAARGGTAAGRRAGRRGARSSGASTASSTATCRRGAAVARSSASCGPTSCSATTRGSGTGCTRTIAHAGLLVCDAHRRRPRPPLLPRPRRAHHRPSVSCCSRPTSPITSRTSPRRRHASSHALEAHESQFESTMHAARRGRAGAFRQRIRDRLAGARRTIGLAAAELFKLIADL